MADAIETLLSILDLEPLERNLFRGLSPQVGWQRVFGGQVIGQALVAAARTVEGRSAHSLHAYFMRPGDPTVPIIYQVNRIRDGKSFATRLVVAIQHGEAIFSMSASFQVAENGFDHQIPMPAAPPPEDLPSEVQQGEAEGWAPFAVGPVESRRVGQRALGDIDDEAWVGWLAPRRPVPEDPAGQLAALAFLCEYRSHWAVERRLGPAFLTTELTLTDFALWIHRPRRWDDFWLVTTTTEFAAAGHCLSRRTIHDRAGVPIASAAWSLAAPARAP